jgi:CO/xanthine dehydrogenase FAD-binding subunit
MHATAPAGLGATELVSPQTLREACAALAGAKRAGRRALLLAGGTDLIVDRHLAPVAKAEPVDLVVDLTAIAELAAIGPAPAPGGRFSFGGGVTYHQLRTDPRVPARLAIFADMARDVGAVQIQTRGTLAGNIATASPAADGVPVLMALEATVRLVREGGERDVPLTSFFTAYRRTVLAADEIIAGIDVRMPPPEAFVRWRKVGTRSAQSISKVALASMIEVERGVVTRARFGMASVAAVTHPLAEVTRAVEGRPIASISRAELAGALARDIKPIDDVRSTGEYRMHVAEALVWQAFPPEGAGATARAGAPA